MLHFSKENTTWDTFMLIFDLCCITVYDTVPLLLHYHVAAAGTLIDSQFEFGSL